MRNIDTNLSDEYAKAQFTHFNLVELYLNSGTYRYTDFQFDLYYGGNKYSPRGMNTGNIGSNIGLSVDKMTFELDDTDLILSALLLSEDVRYKRVSLYKGAIDANYEVIAVAEYFRGTIDSWELPEPRAKITISNELIKWKDKTLRTAGATCPWTFNAPPHTNLLTWREDAHTYETFDSTGANLTSVISTASAAEIGYSGYFNCTMGKIYRLDLNLTLNSGQAPTLSYCINAANSAFVKSKTLASGVNTMIWTAEKTRSGIDYVLLTNTLAANYSIVGTLYEVTECAYIGSADWCDQSYAKCWDLQNQKNFGGMRFIPSLMEKDIWWGRVPG